jgi:chromate reductase
MSSPIHVLGFSGSLRKGSFNSAALRAAMAVLPEDVTMEIFDLSPLPLYNQDLEAAGIPASVQAFKARLAAADALLIATPEHNYSVTAALKNAVDWASRPPGQSPLPGKPVAILGASRGMLGTFRAQYHLRQILVSLDMHPVNRPEVIIGKAAERFDAEGHLTDQATRDIIASLMEALTAWTRRLRGEQGPTV